MKNKPTNSICRSEVNHLTRNLRNNNSDESDISIWSAHRSYSEQVRGHRVWNKEGKRRRLVNQDRRRGTYSDVRRQKYGTRRAKHIQDDGLADKLITQTQRQREKRKKCLIEQLRTTKATT
jgi:hypothetical protein